MEIWPGRLVLRRLVTCKIMKMKKKSQNSLAMKCSTLRNWMLYLQLCILSFFLFATGTKHALPWVSLIATIFLLRSFFISAWSQVLLKVLSPHFPISSRFNPSLDISQELVSSIFYWFHFPVGHGSSKKKWSAFFPSRILCCFFLSSPTSLIQVSNFSPIFVCCVGTSSTILGFSRCGPLGIVISSSKSYFDSIFSAQTEGATV